MKRILFFLLCALLVQSVSFAQLPSVKLSLANNKKFDTKNLADGKTPVVISFWSISCDPCIQEIDALNEKYTLEIPTSYVGEWICVETNVNFGYDLSDSYYSTISDGIDYAKRLFDILGYELTIKEKEEN